MAQSAQPGYLEVYQRRRRRKFRIWPARSLIQVWLTGAGWSDLNGEAALAYLADEPVVSHEELLRWLERRWLDGIQE